VFERLQRWRDPTRAADAVFDTTRPKRRLKNFGSCLGQKVALVLGRVSA
jgi:hypothetical protein